MLMAGRGRNALMDPMEQAYRGARAGALGGGMAAGGMMPMGGAAAAEQGSEMGLDYNDGFAGENMQPAADRGGGINPNSLRVFQDLVGRAGVRDMQGLITQAPASNRRALYEQLLDAGAQQAQTDMEFEAIEQVSRSLGLPSPFQQQRR